MIKVELTKNVFNQRGGGLFGLKPIHCCYRYGCRRCEGAVAYAVMTNETNEAQGVSNSLKLPLKFILENKLSLKEIGTFVTVYDMYLNGEMPITVGGVCQHTSDGIVTVRKYIKRLIDKELLIRDHTLIDGHIVMTITVNMKRLRE